MASYLDRTPVFNPYVQQLPVDEMVKVGMHKQQQYEQGLEKIQSTIDNVAGLDIANPVQKQYLQSKLNSLGNNLKYVAAGDFSNFQLVNSVNGMTKQISKDKNVQNAVYSTAKIRKEQSALEASRKEGKSAIENEYNLNNSISEYINNPNIDASFNGKYKSFIDLNKKWTETVKTLHPNLTEQDIAKVTRYKADGVTVDSVATADAMETLAYKGVSAQQIDNALRSSLTNDDLEQMKMSAEYKFRGMDNTKMPELVAQSMNNIEKNRDDQITYLKTQMALTKGKDASYQKYADSLVILEQKKLTHSKEKEDLINLATQDPSAVKLQIYKEGTINEFTNANSWEERQRKLSTNPILIAEQKRVDQGFEKLKLELAIRIQNHKETQDAIDNNFKERTVSASEKKLDMEQDINSGVTGPATRMPIGTKTQDPYTLSSNQIAENKVVVDSFVQDLVKNSHFDPSLYKTKQERDIAYQKVVANAQKIYNDYKLDPSNTTNIPNTLLVKAHAAFSADQNRTKIQQALNNAKKEAKENEDYDPDIAPLKEAYEKVSSLVKPVTLSYADGKKLVVTPEEILNYNKKLNDNSKNTAQTRYYSNSHIDLTPLTLSNKEKVIHNYIQQHPQQKGLFINNNIYQVQSIYSAYDLKRRQKEAVILNDKLQDFHPLVTGIVTKDKEGRATAIGEQVNQLVNQALLLSDKDKNFGGNLKYENVDEEHVKALIADPKTIYQKILVPGTGEYSIMLQNEKYTQQIPIKDEKAISFVRDRLKSKNDINLAAMKLQTSINRGSRGDANPTNDPFLDDFQSKDFNNIRMFKVTGSPTQTEGDVSSNFLNLKVTLPSGKKISVAPYNPNTKNGSTKMTLDDMLNFVGRDLNDVALAQLIINDNTQSKETIDEVKRMFSVKK